MKVNMVRRKQAMSSLSGLLGICAVIAFWGLEAAAEDPTDRCVPGRHEVALFSETDFRGGCTIKSIGAYPTLTVGARRVSNSANLDGFRFASIKVGADAEALVCGDTNFGENCELVYRETKTLAPAASLIVRAGDVPAQCLPSDDQIGVWQRQYFFGSCRVLDVGLHRSLEVRSLRVGHNVEARLSSSRTAEGDFVITEPGFYSRWTFPSAGGENGQRVGLVEIRRRGEQNCRPGANEIGVFELARFTGRCAVLGIGTHLLQSTLPWVDTNSAQMFRSILVGDDAQFTVCWNNEGARCSGAITSNMPRGTSSFTADNAVRVSVQRRGEEPPQGGSRRTPEEPEVVERDYNILLPAQGFFDGFPWWFATFPVDGDSGGGLLSVKNLTAVWVGLLKRGYGSSDCGNPEAQVVLQRHDVMTDEQMTAVFGSSRPDLPVAFAACSGLVGEVRANGSLTFPPVSLKLTYTR